jgi:hypothetical protein
LSDTEQHVPAQVCKVRLADDSPRTSLGRYCGSADPYH